MEIHDSNLGIRAIVFSGGGVKGVFAAGVVQALRHCDLDMDVITGSSVGALNATLLAEDTLKRRQAKRLEGIKAYSSTDIIDEQLKLWETLEIPDKKVKIFSSKVLTPIILEGTLLMLMAAFLIYTDKTNSAIYTFKIAFSLLGAIIGLSLLNFWFLYHTKLNPFRDKEQEKDRIWLKKIVHGYLNIHGIKISLFTNRNLEDTLLYYVPFSRTFKDYKQEGIDLRITRTNVRTGRMEISEYCPGDESERIVGNPRVVKAALASSAFPSALPPIKVSDLYPREENPDFWSLMKFRESIREEFKNYWGEKGESEYKKFMEHLDLWELRQIERFGSRQDVLKEFEIKEIITSYLFKRPTLRHTPNFIDWLQKNILKLWRYRHYPRVDKETYEDIYFDGGTVDNTPISTALKAMKEKVSKDPSLADKEHLILVILLDTPRKTFLDQKQIKEFRSHNYGFRGLHLLDRSNFISDIKNTAKINKLVGQNEQEMIRANLITIFPEINLPWVLAFDDKLGYNPQKQRTYIAAGCRSGFVALTEAASRKVIPSKVAERLKSLGISQGGNWYCRISKCNYYQECQELRKKVE